MEEDERTEPMEEDESPTDGDQARKHMIRAEAEKLAEAVLNKEARDHLIRAGTEMLLAIDSMIPYDKIPPDVKEHYLGAKRETILLMKALLDVQLQVVSDLSKKEVPPAGLRKIDLE